MQQSLRQILNLEQEKQRADEKTNSAKELAHLSKDVLDAKLNALEEKYSCTKKINVALEWRILQLMAEVERLQIQQDRSSHHPVP